MKGFYITVSNGLLYDNHRKRMGSAVWEFMWLLDKMTSIDESGTGKVLGGKPIRLEEIALSLGTTIQNVSLNIIKLKKHKYINVLRTPYGLVISINKAQKIYKQTRPKNRIKKTLNQENIESKRIKKTLILHQENIESHQENIESNIRQDRDKTEDKTILSPVGKRDSTPEKVELVIDKTKVGSPMEAMLKAKRETEIANAASSRLNKKGLKALEQTRTQKDLQNLEAVNPYLRKLQIDFIKIMEIKKQDGYDLPNARAWAEIYNDIVKGDIDKIMAVIKFASKHEFHKKVATSGIYFLKHWEALNKAMNEKPPDVASDESAEYYTLDGMRKMIIMQELSRIRGITDETLLLALTPKGEKDTQHCLKLIREVKQNASN